MTPHSQRSTRRKLLSFALVKFEQAASIRRRLGACAMVGAFVAGTLCTAAPAFAQTWPTRPITIITPYAAGGPNDAVARLLSDHLSKALGQPVIVDNKAGAGGVIGSMQVMRAQPDGYTLLLANSGALVVQAVVKTPPPYDPTTAFTPIVKIVDAPNFIGVTADLPVNSVGELIALARREPGKLNYTTPGVGSFGNFLGEYFKLLTGTDIAHIPGKGSAAGLTELISGRVQIMIDPAVLLQRSGNRIKVLATTYNSRFDAYPDIPTVKESGGPDLSLVGWFGLLGPANLPKPVIDRLDAATRTMLGNPNVVKALVTQGLIPSPASSAAFLALIRDDVRTYTDIKTRAHINID